MPQTAAPRMGAPEWIALLALSSLWGGSFFFYKVLVQELPPWVALAEPRGEVPDVPGTRWYTGAVPPDVLLTLAPAARLFIAAWRDRQAPKERHGEGLSWDAPGHLPPDRPADRDG